MINPKPLKDAHHGCELLQVNGFAAQYEKTGDKEALTAVQHFFDVITHHHSYATGGQHSPYNAMYCMLLLLEACAHARVTVPQQS